jgi:hypothetical protein
MKYKYPCQYGNDGYQIVENTDLCGRYMDKGIIGKEGGQHRRKYPQIQY